jgi:mono/diheme cytochrome c family protein
MIPRFSCSSILASLVLISHAAGKNGKLTFFESKIAPILEANCLECHNSNISKSDLSLTSLKEALAGGKEGAALIPSNPDESRLIQYITGPDPDMPKKKEALSKDEVELIRKWIASGALWPDTRVLREKPKADKSWWAYQKLSKEKPPSPANLPAAWNKNPIDRYIFAGLTEMP